MGLTNWYRVIGERSVLDYVKDDEFEHEFSAEEEEFHVARGALEIMPRAYRVIGGNEVFGAKPGSVVDLALTKGREEALLYSGNLERAEEADLDDDLHSLKRQDLNEVARERGVEEPEKLPNKKAVVRAIEKVVAETPAGAGEEK